MLEIVGWTPLFHYKENNTYLKFWLFTMPQKLGYIQWLQHKAFYNTSKFKFTKCKGFILDGPHLLSEDLELLAMSSLMRSSSY